MCLEVVAVPAEPDQVSARALADVSGLTVTKSHRSLRNAFHFSREPGCSCSLLADEADWNDPVWAMAPQVLEGLAKAVELIADRAKGVRLQAIWIGEAPATQDRVPLGELLRAIRGNAIRNKHVYLVGKAR
jgi:hypothetical protein